jgi:hypothetical protein
LMRPGSGTEADARSDPSITAQAASSKLVRLALALMVFQRSLTRWRWLLDPLLLELTSQVETDQPLLSCQAMVIDHHIQSSGFNRQGRLVIPCG